MFADTRYNLSVPLIPNDSLKSCTIQGYSQDASSTAPILFHQAHKTTIRRDSLPPFEIIYLRIANPGELAHDRPTPFRYSGCKIASLVALYTLGIVPGAILHCYFSIKKKKSEKALEQSPYVTQRDLFPDNHPSNDLRWLCFNIDNEYRKLSEGRSNSVVVRIRKSDNRGQIPYSITASENGVIIHLPTVQSHGRPVMGSFKQLRQAYYFPREPEKYGSARMLRELRPLTQYKHGKLSNNPGITMFRVRSREDAKLQDAIFGMERADLIRNALIQGTLSLTPAYAQEVIAPCGLPVVRKGAFENTRANASRLVEVAPSGDEYFKRLARKDSRPALIKLKEGLLILSDLLSACRLYRDNKMLHKDIKLSNTVVRQSRALKRCVGAFIDIDDSCLVKQAEAGQSSLLYTPRCTPSVKIGRMQEITLRPFDKNSKQTELYAIVVMCQDVLTQLFPISQGSCSVLKQLTQMNTELSYMRAKITLDLYPLLIAEHGATHRAALEVERTRLLRETDAQLSSGIVSPERGKKLDAEVQVLQSQVQACLSHLETRRSSRVPQGL